MQQRRQCVSAVAGSRGSMDQPRRLNCAKSWMIQSAVVYLTREENGLDCWFQFSDRLVWKLVLSKLVAGVRHGCAAEMGVLFTQINF